MLVRELVGMGRSPYTGFWGKLSKDDKRIVEESIALVRIEELASRMVHTLSDGERQKVMMLRRSLRRLRLFTWMNLPHSLISPAR